MTGFDEFWDRYPRKIAKGTARKAYAKAMKITTHDEIMFGLSQQIEAMAAKEKQFIPHASTWLNGERWDDEPEHCDPLPRSSAGSQAGKRLDPALEQIARLAGLG